MKHTGQPGLIKPGCYTLAAMRRWLLIFLVILLPMQLSWAAVASYCQHESDSAATTQHVGHHEHQHKAAAAFIDTSDTSASPTATGAVDVDCGTCHAGCCSALIQSMPLLAISPASQAYSAPALRLSSHPASLPERPNWADLA